MCGRTEPTPPSVKAIYRRLSLDSGNMLLNMSRIRPEQMSHRKFLKRGRSVRALQYSLLFFAALAAAAGVWVAFVLPLLGLQG